MSMGLYKESDIQTIADIIREEQGYTGKNQFNIKKILYRNSSSAAIYIHNDNTITVDGKGTWGNGLIIIENINKNVNMTLSALFSETNYTSIKQMSVYGTDEISVENLTTLKNSENYEIEKGKEFKFNVSFNTSNYKYLAFRFWINRTNSFLPDLSIVNILNIQLEEGNQETPYEPYCRYKISDMPKEIKNLAKYYKQYIPKATSQNGICENALPLAMKQKIYGNIEQDTEGISPDNPKEFKTLKGTDGYIKENITSADLSKTIQIYLGDNELLTEDYIEIDDEGNENLFKEWNKFVLNGNENWNMNTSGGYKQFYINFSLGKSGFGYSTHFTYNMSDIIKGNHFYINLSETLMVFPHPNNSSGNIETLQEWKDWLSTNRPTIWYKTKTTEIINLGKHNKIIPFEGTNLLDIEATLQPSKIESNYYIKSATI